MGCSDGWALLRKFPVCVAPFMLIKLFNNINGAAHTCTGTTTAVFQQCSGANPWFFNGGGGQCGSVHASSWVHHQSTPPPPLWLWENFVDAQYGISIYIQYGTSLCTGGGGGGRYFLWIINGTLFCFLRKLNWGSLQYGTSIHTVCDISHYSMGHLFIQYGTYLYIVWDI